MQNTAHHVCAFGRMPQGRRLPTTISQIQAFTETRGRSMELTVVYRKDDAVGSWRLYRNCRRLQGNRQSQGRQACCPTGLGLTFRYERHGSHHY